jgi:transcription elongation factor Elf1
MKVMKVMLNGKQIFKQPSKTKNKRKTKMTLLDHTFSCFFLNNKKVKTYPHKYEEGEKEKKMV